MMKKILLSTFFFFLLFMSTPFYGQENDNNLKELIDSVLINDSLAQYYANIGELRIAYDLSLKNVAINQLWGENSVPYAVSLLKMARYIPDNQEEYDSEVSLKGLTILKDSLGFNTTYIKYLLEYAWRLDDRGKHDEAIEITKEAAYHSYQNNELLLGYLYYSFSDYLNKAQKFEESYSFAIKAKSFFESNGLIRDDYYPQTLIELSSIRFKLGDSLQAMDYLHQAEESISNTKGIESIEYLDINMNLSHLCRALCQYEEALKYAKIANTIGEKIKGEYAIPYIDTVESLSKCYSKIEQYDEAISLAESSLSLVKECPALSLEERLPILDSLINYSRYVQDMEKYNYYAKEAYLTRKILKVDGEDIERALSYLIDSYFGVKKYDDCENSIKELRGLYGDRFAKEYKYYYNTMEMLWQCHTLKGNYTEALSAIQETVDNYVKFYSREDDYYIHLLKTLAAAFYNMGDVDEYINISNTVLDYWQKKNGYSNTTIGEIISQASDYLSIGKYLEAFSLFDRSYQISKDLNGLKNSRTILCWLCAVATSSISGEAKIEVIPIDTLFDYYHTMRRNREMRLGSHEEIDKIMHDHLAYLTLAIDKMVKLYKSPTDISHLYDCLLLLKKKGNSYLELGETIENSCESEVIRMYELLNKTTNQYVISAKSGNKEGLDSLQVQIHSCIKYLKEQCTLFSDYYNKTLTTDSLKNQLQDNEVIVDYYRHQTIDGEFKELITILDKRSEGPILSECFDLKDTIGELTRKYDFVFIIDDTKTDSICSLLGYRSNITPNVIVGYNDCIKYIHNRFLDFKREKRSTSTETKDDFLASQDLFNVGVMLYDKKQYDDAIILFCKSDSLMKNAKGEKSNYYGHGKQWISSCYYKMGVDSIAKQYSNYYNLQPIDMRQTLLSDSLLDIAIGLYDQGNKEEAIAKFIEASVIEKNNLGGNSYWYANTISHIAEICNEIGDYKRAIEFETEALDIRKNSPGINHIDYYWSLKNLFSSYSAQGMVEDKYKLGGLIIDFMDNNSDLLGAEKSYLPIYASIMTVISIEKNNKQEAYTYIEKLIHSIDLVKDQPAVYIHMYYNAIMGLQVIGRDSLSFELCKRAIPLYEKHLDKQINPNEFFEILLIAANHYFKQGDFITTCLYQERALEEIKDKKSWAFGIALSHLAMTYSELGRIDESILFAKEAVSICDTIPYLDGYVKTLSTLAHCYSIANKPKDALRCGNEVLNLLIETKGVDDNQTLVAANNLASYYEKLGYIDEAKKCILFVLGHASEDLSIYGETLGTAYNNLAMKWTTDSISLNYICKAYDIRKTVLGENNIYTIQSLYNKGICLYNKGEVIESVGCIRKAMDQTKNIFGENNLRYVEMMEILPIIYGRGGDLTRALEIQKEISTLLKGIVGEEHINYLESLDDLSELYFYTNDTINLYSTVIDESQKYQKMIFSDFSNYTSIERAHVINGMSHFFDWLFPLVCYYKQQPILCSELYNALLLRKGILLNSEIELGKLIRESGDTTLVHHYNDLIVSKGLLNKLYQLPEKQRAYDIDSLKHVIYEKEDYLVSASKEYGNYTKRLRINWKNIRDNLNDDELSVEFVEFYDTCTIQNRIYYALIIDKHSESPELIPLCMETQINEVMNSNKNGGLYRLIWNPILQKKKNVKTIFFSPSGILNNIGIEYLDINEHENVSDKYSLYRLSSTREIIEKQKSSCKSAALYGGLDYSVDTNVLLAQINQPEFGISSSVMYRGLSDSLSVRNSFEPLYNTKTEIIEIDKTLKKGNVDVSTYSDTFGTEESFKALSGKGMNLIHLATHGMYVGATDAESRKKDINLSFIQLDENEGAHIQEDKSLSRSFLVMSGGDMLPSHKEIPDYLEDGILTASEISRLDLRGLDLVVLSACQTALGDIDNEGVYGLQRGFKKAGANTILMSLDKVDDEATKILMVEFYKNLMNGKSKHQSLKKAQKYLRQVDNGKYDKPEFWASFIMLDGLN